MTSQRERRTPSGPGACASDRARISAMLATLLPLPTGPKMSRAKASDWWNRSSVAPEGRYSMRSSATGALPWRDKERHAKADRYASIDTLDQVPRHLRHELGGADRGRRVVGLDGEFPILAQLFHRPIQRERRTLGERLTHRGERSRDLGLSLQELLPVLQRL